MNRFQKGFGGLQVVISIAAIAVVTLVAVPKYQAFMTRAKLTEAYNLAGESKRKLSQFYSVNSRFPTTTAEAESTRAVALSEPEYVRELVVEPRAKERGVVVKVYLKDGVVENTAGGEQYVFIAGNAQSGGSYAVSWRCGAEGVDASLLPEDCRG